MGMNTEVKYYHIRDIDTKQDAAFYPIDFARLFEAVGKKEHGNRQGDHKAVVTGKHLRRDI